MRGREGQGHALTDLAKLLVACIGTYLPDVEPAEQAGLEELLRSCAAAHTGQNFPRQQGLSPRLARLEDVLAALWPPTKR